MVGTRISFIPEDVNANYKCKGYFMHDASADFDQCEDCDAYAWCPQLEEFAK